MDDGSTYSVARFSLGSMEMGMLTWVGTAELVSRDQIVRRERGQGNTCFPCSVDHEQDWQPYPVDPYSCYMLCDHTHQRTQLTIVTNIIEREFVATAILLSFLYHVRFLFVWRACLLCFLPIHSGHQVRWTYQSGLHRRKVTQEEGHTGIFIRLFFCGECLNHSFPSWTVKSNFVYY